MPSIPLFFNGDRSPNPPPMPRLFAAIRPPAAVRERLLVAMGGVEGARWQSDDQLHATLRFFGEVDRHAADDLLAALASLSLPAPTMRVEGTGSFDRRGRVDTVWARLVPREPIAAVAARVERAAQLAGLPPDRRAYLPHITLARGRMIGAGAWVERTQGLTTGSWAPERWGVYESTLGRGGADYALVDAFGFRG